MTACGRKQPVRVASLEPFERPLSGKAAVQIWAFRESRLSVRFTPVTSTGQRNI